MNEVDHPIQVLFLPRGTEKTASSRIRVFNVVPYLKEKESIKPIIVSKDTYQKHDNLFKWIIGIFSYFFLLIIYSLFSDIIYVQKTIYSLPVRLFLKHIPAKVIYDFDDAVYAPHPWKNQDEIEAEENRIALHSMFEIASTVTVGSPSLGRYAKQHHENVHVLPPSLPKRKYERKVKHQKSNTVEKTVIGWIGNPQNLFYLNKFREPLRKVLEQNPECELHVISSDSFEIKGVEEQIKFVEWSSETEVDNIRNFDIAIRPMTKDEYTQKKGGLVSVLQCMALGIPVILTPVESAKDIIEDSKNGVFADSDEEWVNKLQLLISEPSKRYTIGQNAARKIEKEYFIDKRVFDYINVFQQTLLDK